MLIHLDTREREREREIDRNAPVSEREREGARRGLQQESERRDGVLI
jgi:hypothetical protein